MASSRAVSGPLDRTWRCTPASGPFSGKPTLGIHGSPKTARIDPFFVLSSRQPPQDAGSHFGTAALQFDAASTTVNWDKQLCKPVHEQPVFGSRGLVQNNVYTSTFLGSFSGDCATPPAVLIRAHITFAHAGASAARVVVVSAAKQKPLAYVTWTPHRIAVWVARACDVRAYPY
jgi:hypothetical protein